MLLSSAVPLGPAAEALLFSAARSDHLDRTIRPALAAGQWVVCDRFTDSTRAYQGVLGRVDRRFITGLEDLVVGETRPELTLIIDVPAELGLARAAARRSAGVGADRFEKETLDFHQRLRSAFLDIAAAEPWRCAVIDGAAAPDDVAAAIAALVDERLASGRGPATPGRGEARSPSPAKRQW
jgi:dTMP kinase